MVAVHGLKKAIRLLLFPCRWLRFGSELSADETVVLFPQCASRNPAGGWDVPLHAWVVELESGSLSRRISHQALIELLQIAGVINEQKNSMVFRNRLDWFMADREINKRLKIQISDQTHMSPRSPPSGHIKFLVQYHGNAPAGSVIEYRVAQTRKKHVSGQIQLVARRGLSVISDIDDTIKISNVTSKKALVKGVFFDEYKVAGGMPEFYNRLEKRDVCFHYVSSSPWQLYPGLAPLLKKFYPTGSVSLRHFYIANRSFIDFFRHSRRYKLNVISDLLNRFPQRDFILIGDSGEKDPEIYAEIAGRYSDQVMGIFIRQVSSASEHSEDEHRWHSLRQRLVNPDCFRVFTDPATLYDYADYIVDQSEFSLQNRPLV